MAEEHVISFRLSTDLLERIDVKSTASGKSRSDCIRDVLQDCFPTNNDGRVIVRVELKPLMFECLALAVKHDTHFTEQELILDVLRRYVEGIVKGEVTVPEDVKQAVTQRYAQDSKKNE